MHEILLVIHLMLAIAIVALVLLQRSEGGALGIGGGGGGGGGLMTGRAAGNLLTKMTAVAAGLFMLTSLGLTMLASTGDRGSILERIEQQPQAPANQPAVPPAPTVPAVPQSD